jgi:hypothetical protein
MTTRVCGYPERDEAIVAFLYDDGSGESITQRTSFEAHLTTCDVCRYEIEALRGIRTQLGQWTPPEPTFAFTSATLTPPSPQPGLAIDARPTKGWHAIPAWAQVAAALLFLGVAAGIANLNVHYDSSGLTIRTGWSAPRESLDLAATRTNPPSTAEPWKTDLAALRDELTAQMRALPPAAAPHPNDADLVRRVRALVEESEKRQQRELALRLTEMMRDVAAQRQADLVKVDRALGLVENKVGVEVLKNRQQMNYFIRTSQREQ